MTTLAMLSSTEISLIAGIFALGLILTVIWIWGIIHCARRISAGETGLVGWLIVICLLQAIGAIAYFLFGRTYTLRLPREAPSL